MKVSFNLLPPQAKVWMYQAERKLNEAERAELQKAADFFLSEWESHGIPVQGSVDLLQDMTIRVAAFTNEDSMCGRAQDSQMRLIKALEGQLNVQLTNRMILAWGEEGEEQIAHMGTIPALVANNAFSPETPFYNNLVLSKSEFETAWKTKAGESWIQTYF